MAVEQRPIEPTGLVILAVGVVIALLGAAHLVAGGEHGDAAREQQDGRKVAYLPVAERLDRRIVGFTLDAAVPAQVIVDAVAVAFAVGLVVLVVIGDQVVEGEAIVAGYKVDAIDRQPSLVLIEIGTAGQAGSHGAHQSRIALDEAADIVAIAAVPLRPAIPWKMPDLIQSGGVPGLGDHFGIGQFVIQLDLPHHRRMGAGHPVLAPRQDGAFIEAEAIDVGFPHPVTQTFDDELLGYGVVAVEGISAAGEIHVILQVPGHQKVVSAVVDALERESRT